jgi:hypothetical protein
MKIFANVSVSANTSDSFLSMIGKTNQALYAFANTVTVAGNTDGDSSTGNGFVIGIFGANVLVANTIQGGNVSASSNLNISGNLALQNTTIFFNNTSVLSSNSYVTSNNTAQIVDSFATATYAGGKFVIGIRNNVNNDRHMTEIMMMQSTGANALITEYASLFNNTTLGTFSANVDTGLARLYFTPTNANNTLQISKTLISV